MSDTETTCIIVCGGRNYADKNTVAETLWKLEARFKQQLHVRHGGATGADSLADYWARICKRRVEPVLAQWDKYGRGAGPRRNHRMLTMLPAPVLVVAFPGGRGTADMVKQAKAAGVEVMEISGD